MGKSLTLSKFSQAPDKTPHSLYAPEIFNLNLLEMNHEEDHQPSKHRNDIPMV